jgi:hypothetical protein
LADRVVKRNSSAPSSSEPPARQVEGFIAKFDPKIQRMIRSVRKAVRRRLPTAVELVYDNYNFFVIGYGPNERASEAVLSIAAYARGVGLAFLHGATLPDPKKILEGAGKQNRFLRLDSAADLDAPAVEALIRAAKQQSKTPFPATGRCRTVIKSISAKQRPRRAAAGR